MNESTEKTADTEGADSEDAETEDVETGHADVRALEAGRLLFAGGADFMLSVVKMADLPEPGPIEIAFAGRSNVGKSSLINALTNRNRLAHTSKTPGRTQALNYYQVSPDLRLVDMPGYGYARAPKTAVAAWTALIMAYLKGRATLRRAFVLVDARHGLKDSDLGVMETLDKAAVSYQVVLTKADKVKPAALEAVKAKTSTALLKRPAAFPEILATSSESGTGIPALRAEINSLIA